VAGGIGAYLYASKIATRRYRLEVVGITTAGGGATDRPLRILHISDLHLTAPESHKIEFLKRATDGDYDFIFLTGDVFENEGGLKYAGQILSRSPRLGAYAVLGNHDYYDYKWFNKTIGRINRKYRHPTVMRDVRPLIEALADGGFTTLRNEGVTHAQDRVHVVGIDYPGITDSKLTELIDSAPPGCLVLALQHVPKRLDALAETGADVVFCGHTHGGQIRLPGFGAFITDSELPRHEASGVVWRQSTAIHVSRGISADPKTNFRLFCPPAATVVEVVAKTPRS
jgi:predicted MPP superfamily phosphohydrolase